MGVLKTCIGGFKPAVLRSGYGFVRVPLREAAGGWGMVKSPCSVLADITGPLCLVIGGRRSNR